MVKSWLGGVAVVVLALATGCGVTDPGTGTRTLEFTMSMEYSSNGPDSTTATLSVAKSGVQVTNPNILLTDLQTRDSYPITPPSGVVQGYHRNMQVQVTAGVDSFSCQIEGPSRFSISQPLQAKSHNLKDDLRITWETPDGLHADRVEVHLKNAPVNNSLAVDDGFYTIPAGLLRAGNETVTVVRITKVVPAGATGSSLVEMRFKVSVDFTVK